MSINTELLATATLANLAAMYNAHTDKPIKKFVDKPTGIARVTALAEKLGLVVESSTDGVSLIAPKPEAPAERVLTATPVRVTVKEYEVLQAVHNSEYHDGNVGVDKIGWHVWSDCIWTTLKPTSHGGVIASLVKKGLITQQGHDKDATVALTELGYVSFRDYDAAQALPESDEVAAKPARGKKGPAPKAGDAQVITVLVANPKRKTSASYARFALYTAGMTVGEYLKAAVALQGGTEGRYRADIYWDVAGGFISLGA